MAAIYLGVCWGDLSSPDVVYGRAKVDSGVTRRGVERGRGAGDTLQGVTHNLKCIFYG